MTRLLCLLLLLVLCAGASLKAEPSRTLLKSLPKIGGREVKELVLTAPISFGGNLGPGMPTIRNYTVKPNRFVPVSEDPTFVYYQAEGAFAEGSGGVGGFKMNKKYPDMLLSYWGDARYPKIKLSSYETLSPAEARLVRVHYAR